MTTFLGSASATATFGDYAEIAALHHETRDKVEAVRAAVDTLEAVLGDVRTAVQLTNTKLDDGTASAVTSKSDPANRVIPLTPSDTVALATVPDALLVTADGTLSVKGTDNTAVSLGTVKAGQLIPLRARNIMVTGTTATVVGLLV